MPRLGYALPVAQRLLPAPGLKSSRILLGWGRRMQRARRKLLTTVGLLHRERAPMHRRDLSTIPTLPAGKLGVRSVVAPVLWSLHVPAERGVRDTGHLSVHGRPLRRLRCPTLLRSLRGMSVERRVPGCHGPRPAMLESDLRATVPVGQSLAGRRAADHLHRDALRDDLPRLRMLDFAPEPFESLQTLRSRPTHTCTQPRGEARS